LSYRKLRIAALLLAAAPAAYADINYDFDEVTLPEKADKAIVGGALSAGRRYLGSDERRIGVVPLFEYRWSNGWFAGLGNGVGYNFSTERGLSYGLRMSVDFGRKESRSVYLTGMGDIKAKPEFGGFYNQELGNGLSVHTSLRYGAVGTGLVVDGGVDWSTPIAASTHLKLGATVTVVNTSYMQDYFGVTPEQSASSAQHYTAFKASGGIRDVRVGVGISHVFSQGLVGTAGLNVRSLQGDAAVSPLTREKTSPGATVSVIYAF